MEPRRYQTLTQKANVSMQLDEHQHTMGCTVQLWRNELIIISLQPMLGIEMVRIEVNQDSVLIFDKMNRRYTTINFSDASTTAIHPTPSFKMIQEFMTVPTTPKIQATS